MTTHDCNNCKMCGNCPMESVAPWLNEHEEEGTQAVHDAAEELSKTCFLFVSLAPMLLGLKEEVVALVETAFLLGYHKGRTYQDIPSAFKKM